MISALKAEFLKLFTVRSTYFLTLLAWIVVAAVGFFGVGFTKSAAELKDPTIIQQSIFGSAQFIGLIAAIVAILLLAYEYRYNTINYSFTLHRSRSKILASKFVVITGYAIVLSLVAIGVVVGCVYAGAAANGHHLGAQIFSVISPSDIFGQLFQAVFFVWGMAMAGLIVTALLRSLVASVAFVFVFPSLEQLVTLISKTLVGYLPFTALNAVTKLSPEQSGFSVDKSLIIYLIYFVVFSIIAWRLFLKRDAG